ncbi:fatty acid desaturase [Alkalimarinus alittae]|uniref:Fatty acid desaturase n=1 Tax=Alkalimarinus alittae TaxID=2961619 RepID=A0ABY6N7C8_9ALTE|nr:fatty acid desaturase [Alkalimarinus alittae]UZE97994.1 fatty acid desaturase [Alkalimarinus alittae]
MKTSTLNTLTHQEFENFGNEIEQLRQEVLADLGQRDADHIRSIIKKQRYSEIAGRTLIQFGLNPLSWAAGVGLLSVSKILENMEIGHNVMHGQYDWMNDPELNSQSYEWDTVCDSESWRNTHNFEHHTYTNILGKDRDYGYAVLRLTDDEPWKPRHLFQLVNYGVLSAFFQWGVGLHELEIDRIKSGEISWKDKIPFVKRFSKKAAKQVAKDYLFFPALAGPGAPKVIAGNLLANLNRNLWTSTIIFCGHFTGDAQTFSEEECKNETRGQWYYRQLLGSSNFTGGKWLHIMSGHLSYQIEHHMFPDIPSHRYPEMAIKVQQLCKKYDIPYNTGSFGRQYKSVLARIARYSLPPKKSAPLSVS